MSGHPALNLSGELHLTRRILPMRGPAHGVEWSSGVACASMLLEYHGLMYDRTEEEVGMIMNSMFASPYAETHPDRMVEFLRAEGLSVISGESGDIELICDAIDAGRPALVLHSSRGGGWRLAVGYELPAIVDGRDAGKIFLADRECLTAEGAPEFHSLWHEGILFERTRERYYILAMP